MTGAQTTTGTQLTGYITVQGVTGNQGTTYVDCSAVNSSTGQSSDIYSTATSVSISDSQFTWTPSTAGTYTISCSANYTGQYANGTVYTGDITIVVSGPVSILYPAYQVTSIIYAAPGNKSSNAFSASTTNGTTTTIGSSFQNASTITFTEGISAFGVGGSASQSFGASAATSNSNAFTETFTDATGVSNQSVSTNPNAVNHNEDLFLIWLNPQLNLTGNGSAPTSYSVGVRPAADGYTPLPDIVEIFADVMKANSAGASTVPATWLNQQIDAATGELTPGLAAICKNLKTAEYAGGTCTLADQCGCTPTDFAPILALDPLLSYSGTTSPLNANVSRNCGTLPTPSGSNCRYVPVPSSTGSTLQEVETLSGPESQGGNNNCNSFTQGENTNTTKTLGGSVSESVGASFKEGSPGFSLTEANTMTWTQSQSTGTSGGSGVSQSVNLCSATVGCGENVSVYEDTVYHTFVFQQPSTNASCP